MKKMKVVASAESPSYAVYEDPRTRLRHQSLFLDYEELEKETEAMKSKLQNMKLKKLTLSAEVQFLRRRYKYLLKNQSLKPLKQDVSHSPKFETRAPTITKGRNYNRKESTLRPPVFVSGMNPKERNYNGMEAKLRKNQKERIYSGKESTKKTRTPIFDLNQISLEEEEVQGNCDPLRTEEPKKCIQRGLSDEQLSEAKLSVCRNIGNGSSRAGKRKISWQDQVALRV
ncbi:Ribosomal RNA small subunit methyltransferase G [Quillaja saponaria]|uniref:Ribosomal RNA small subunit methyltransferase G n=1 Tax=Quillaja saponaria TaxID=32244 RepID=A0AAD7LCM0_QUISA|nr:Ribosomal RNA small subunit methyltransferase G [Quillaja saponaria]